MKLGGVTVTNILRQDEATEYEKSALVGLSGSFNTVCDKTNEGDYNGNTIIFFLDL